jgi:hypothetical protein
MRRREPVDEEFCRCVLEELRDGQTMTVQTEQPEAVVRTLARLGATDSEMERLTIQGLDGAGDEDDPDDEDSDYESDDDDEVAFADPGGQSALRAATTDNPRELPCPSCGAPNRLTPEDASLGYQCDACADAAERGAS